MAKPASPDKSASKQRHTACDPPSEPVVQNLVYTANLMTNVNVRLVAEAIKGHYDPNKFPACTIRFREPWASLGICGNGKVVVTGAKTEDIAIDVLYTLIDKLHKKLSLSLEVHNFRLQNLVASFRVGFGVNLQMLFDDYRERAAYSKEDIGALRIWRDGMFTSLVLTIWHTGKAHVAGAKTMDEVREIYRFVDFSKYQLGHEYRDPAVPLPPPPPRLPGIRERDDNEILRDEQQPRARLGLSQAQPQKARDGYEAEADEDEVMDSGFV